MRRQQVVREVICTRCKAKATGRANSRLPVNTLEYQCVRCGYTDTFRPEVEWQYD